jgi:hypothetical protein
VGLRPDAVDRELANNAAAWLNPLYGNSMKRKYTDVVDPAILALPSVDQMRDALVQRELAAAAGFRKDGGRDFDLVLDVQAGMRKQGPRNGAVTVETKTKAFLDGL